MRFACSVFLVLAACGGSSKPAAHTDPPPPETAAVTVPPGGTVVAGEDGDAARASFAIGFVQAVAHRDHGAIEGYTDPRGFCVTMSRPEDVEAHPDFVDKCGDELERANQEALGYYEQYVPETFETGETTSYPVAADKGIYMIVVFPADGDEEKGVSVTLFEAKGRRFVMFPQKKEE
jgi:hypothetical protein